MYGISRTAPGRLENKYLFAGKEIQRNEFGTADGLGYMILATECMIRRSAGG